jgi:hypothetical protein
MIPAGNYFAKGNGPLIITDAKSGSQRAIVPMRITKGDQEGQLIDFRGSLSEGKALEITNRALEAMGYDYDDDASVTRNEVQIVVQHEEYNGKTYANIQFVNDPNRAAIYTPSSASIAAAAKARLKAAAIAAKATKPAASSGNPDDEPRF